MVTRATSTLEFFQQRINVYPVNYLIYNTNRMVLVDEIFLGGSIITWLGV